MHGALSDSLKETLRRLVESGDESNPALAVLLRDYTAYHRLLVIVGGLFLLGFIVLSAFFWRRFRRTPKVGDRRWTFEKKTYLCFGVLSVLVGLFLALVVAGNVSNVLNPRTGFEGAIGLLGAPKAGTQAAELQQSFATWLASGDTQTPATVQQAIDNRLSWQRPKAIICSLLLVLSLIATALVWRRLIRSSRSPQARWSVGRVALLLLGVVLVGVCLVLMLMVMGNTQGSIAPISLTLFYG